MNASTNTEDEVEKILCCMQNDMDPEGKVILGYHVRSIRIKELKLVNRTVFYET